MRRTTILAAGLALILAVPASAAQDVPERAVGDFVRGLLAATPPDSRPAQNLPGAGGDLCGRWDSSTRSRFHHVIEAPAGRARLRIEARTTSPGGETVAVYPSVNGDRGRVRIMFVIATTRGHTSEGYVTIPRPAPGEQQGRLPVIVDVENASGRRFSGDYCITVHPA